MAIDIQNDELLTLAQACRILPSKPSPATLWRWRTKGVKIDGKSIRLECIRVGRKWYTSESAFSDFLKRQTAASTVPKPEEHIQSDIVDEQLQELGLLE